MAEQRAVRLADSRGLKALFIIRAGDGLSEQSSRALTDAAPWDD